jgi:hypothetical protein
VTLPYLYQRFGHPVAPQGQRPALIPLSFATEHVIEMDIFVAQLHCEDCAAEAQECTQAIDATKRLTEAGLEGEFFWTRRKWK